MHGELTDLCKRNGFAYDEAEFKKFRKEAAKDPVIQKAFLEYDESPKHMVRPETTITGIPTRYDVPTREQDAFRKFSDVVKRRYDQWRKDKTCIKRRKPISSDIIKEQDERLLLYKYSRSSDDAPVIQYARKNPSKWLDGVEYPWSEKRGEYGRWSRANGRLFYRSYEDAVQAASKKKIK